MDKIFMKRFHIQYGIGKAKYVVSHHDGIKTHDDGSPFYDVTILRNKKTLSAFIRNLREKGYIDE